MMSDALKCITWHYFCSLSTHVSPAFGQWSVHIEKKKSTFHRFCKIFLLVYDKFSHLFLKSPNNICYLLLLITTASSSREYWCPWCPRTVDPQVTKVTPLFPVAFIHNPLQICVQCCLWPVCLQYLRKCVFCFFLNTKLQLYIQKTILDPPPGAQTLPFSSFSQVYLLK